MSDYTSALIVYREGTADSVSEVHVCDIIRVIPFGGGGGKDTIVLPLKTGLLVVHVDDAPL
jgi:hypothetical protein